MPFLSEFSSDGGSPFRLKIKNGPYVDEYLSPSAGERIRDFTAQDDSLIVNMTAGDVYIGKRVNELIPIHIVGQQILSAAVNRDVHIGGNPYSTSTTRTRTAILRYSGTTSVAVFRGITGQTPVTTYLPGDGNLNVNSVATTNNMIGQINRVVFIGDELFYIRWSATDDRLFIYQWDPTTSSWNPASFTYSGSNTNIPATGTFNGTTVGSNAWSTMTWPEINNNNLWMVGFYTTGSTYHKIHYSSSTNAWVIEDITTGPTSMPTTQPSCLAIDGSNWIITYSNSTNGIYSYSTDGGDTWQGADVGAFGSYFFKQCGSANGRFYTINTPGVSTTLPGCLMSTTTPNVASSWVFEDSAVSLHHLLRNNGNGTACYASTGWTTGPITTQRNQPHHSILKFIG